MDTYAIIQNGRVTHLIRYANDWPTIPAGWTLVKVNPGEEVNIGWTYDAGRIPRFMFAEVEE